MLQFEVAYRRNGSVGVETYKAITYKQVEYEFERKHSCDEAEIVSCDVVGETEYIVMDKMYRKPLFNICEKTKNRAIGELKRKIKGDHYRTDYIVTELPIEKDILAMVYKIGATYNSGYPDGELPNYLEELGKWKRIGKRVYKRIS